MVEDERINVNGLMVSEDFLFRYIGALHNEKTKLKKKVEELEKDNKLIIKKRDYMKMVEDERFIKKEYDFDWWFVFDRTQRYTDDIFPCPFEDVEDLIPMSEDQVIVLLNSYWKRIEYDIKENASLHKRMDLMVDFLEEKGLKEECIKYMTSKI